MFVYSFFPLKKTQMLVIQSRLPFLFLACFYCCCCCLATEINDIAPTPQNWVHLADFAPHGQAYYPPVGGLGMPVYYTDSTVVPAVTLTLDTVVAPFCHTYNLTGGAGFQIFCR